MRDPDELLRAACFAELQRLVAVYPSDIPYRGVLDAGFRLGDGTRVPFLTPYKGIFRARHQRGPAALSINTSSRSPYPDRATADGWIYSYRDGRAGAADNRALSAAHALQTPIVYFHATAPGYYKPLFPWYVDVDDPYEREVHVTPGPEFDPGRARSLEPLDDPIERQYRFRQTRVRIHQATFRRLVLPPYESRCAICSLREERLLDAAHIIGDAEADGEPLVSNGLSLCSIHHRAFDEQLVGVSPDYRVHISRRLLDEDDGPMLDVLKGFHRQRIQIPEKRRYRPDPERLARRFERFEAAG